MEHNPLLNLRFKLRILGAFLLLGIVCPAHSGSNPSASDGDLALLPPYCQDANWDGRVMDTERRAVWRARLGQSFQGLHHYCWGLIKLRRAMVIAEKDQRSFTLKSAVGEFQYAIANSSADFLLLPEMFYRMGETHLADNNLNEALRSFEASRARRADYWPSYLKAAEALDQVKLRGRALDLLREGLSYSPSQPAMLERYKAWGGKFPIPVAPAVTAAAEAAEAAASAETTGEPASKASL